MSGFADSLMRSQGAIDSISASLDSYFKKKAEEQTSKNLSDMIRSKMGFGGKGEEVDVQLPKQVRKPAQPSSNPSAAKSDVFSAPASNQLAESVVTNKLKQNPVADLVKKSLTVPGMQERIAESPVQQETVDQSKPAAAGGVFDENYAANLESALARIAAENPEMASTGAFATQLDRAKKIKELSSSKIIKTQYVTDPTNPSREILMNVHSDGTMSSVKDQQGIPSMRPVKPRTQSFAGWVNTKNDPNATPEEKAVAAKNIIDYYQAGARRKDVTWANAVLANPESSQEQVTEAQNIKKLTEEDNLKKSDLKIREARDRVRFRLTYSGADEKTIGALADAFNTSGTLPPALAAGNPALKLQVIAEARKRNPNMNPATQAAMYGATKQALTQLNRVAAGTESSSIAAGYSLDSAIKYMRENEIPRIGDSPMFTQGVQWWEKNINGNPQLSAFENYVFTALREYAKVVSGGSGSIRELSTSAQKAAERLLNASYNPEQFEEVVASMKQDMQNYTNGLKEGVRSQVEALSNDGSINDGDYNSIQDEENSSPLSFDEVTAASRQQKIGQSVKKSTKKDYGALVKDPNWIPEDADFDAMTQQQVSEYLKLHGGSK